MVLSTYVILVEKFSVSRLQDISYIAIASLVRRFVILELRLEEEKRRNNCTRVTGAIYLNQLTRIHQKLTILTTNYNQTTKLQIHSLN